MKQSGATQGPIRVRKRKHRYNDALNRTKDQLEAHRALEQEQLRRREWEGERLKLLVDFVYCQEELQRILRVQQRLMERAEQEPLDRSSSAAAAASGRSWAHTLLASATLQQLQQVTRMTAHDWRAEAGTTFAAVVQLLELATREAAGQEAAAAAPDAADAGGLCKGALAALRQLSEQQAMPRIAAAMLHAPGPLYDMASRNLITGELAAVPPSVVRCAVQRLHLSRQQRLHLRIIGQEYGRMRRASACEGERLAALSMQLAAIKLQGQPRGAAGSSGSSRPAAAAAAAAAAGAGAGAGAEAEAAEAGVPPGESPGEGLSRQLRRYVGSMNVHMTAVGFCIMNTLTLQQLATFKVACYPFYPHLTALTEVDFDAAPPGAAAEGEEGAAGSSSGLAADRADRGTQRGSAATASDPARCAWGRAIEEHMAAREAVLQQQLERWWREREQLGPLAAEHTAAAVAAGGGDGCNGAAAAAAAAFA